VIVSGLWINWSIVGAMLLLILFQGSSNFSEEIRASKYPEYKDYQSRVPRFIPGTKGQTNPNPAPSS
jgi:steroid 5-alpha reductase family enzyme